MSTKKKAFSGSTMTLKDFHGGSIPSDLPLPSAPGVVVRPSSDHRQIPNAWTNNSSGSSNRSDHHHHHLHRPESSGSSNNRSGSSSNSNNYDEKGSFFTHSSHIGRNFDEDERKPLDGVSLPRRTVSDESGGSNRVVLPTATNLDSSSSGRLNGLSITNPVLQQQHQMIGNNGGAYPGRFSGSNPVPSGGSVQSSSVPNAWGTRKEVMSVGEPVNQSNWSGPNVVSRFAQASALEKVSSGRWQTKPPAIHQPGVEVIRFSDDSDFRSAKDNSLYNEVNLMNEKADFDIMRARYGEKNQIVEDEITATGGKGYQERARSPMYSEVKESNLSFHRDVVRPTSTDGKLGGAYMQSPVSTEVVERPKIKLLPRSNPLDNSEALVDYTQGHQLPSHSTHVETSNGVYGNEILSKLGSAGSEGHKRVVERPRLNLKPRFQPPEQADAIAEKERKALFGDARPRELVLKERGVDDDAINNLDVIQPPNRLRHDSPKTKTKPDTVNTTPVYVDRAEKFLHDQKSGKAFDRKDHRTDFDKNEHRGSWRNENWRNNRVTEKHQQQERHPEPETWRKSVEEPNSPSSDAAGLRYGKAASALELAQAFSRSNSGPKTVERHSGQKGLPGRNQIPFSRLTETREFYSGPTPRRQINGY